MIKYIYINSSLKEWVIIFKIGCNYWTSHAATDMWVNWREDIVEKDFRVLSEHGVKYLRVFPNWRDFQPIEMMYAECCREAEVRLVGDIPITDINGLSEVMLERFDVFCSLAEKYNLTLIVALITGWMSGRLFVPPAISGRNVNTDPFALMWQRRFVTGFVQRFKDKKVIEAWGLGNECNCCGKADKREHGYLWTSNVVDAIRAVDNTREIYSDMHSLTVNGAWNLFDQGELCDVLTVHPYPVFTPHCNTDPINTMKTTLHATAESELYAGLGGKPCMVEEIGSLGSSYSSAQIASEFMRCNLFSSWANGATGLLWWCANDQSHLNKPPYEWNAMERELGLLDLAHKPKETLFEMQKFGSVLKRLPFESLPPKKTDAVCILTQDQDQWGVAYMAFILGKQAGLEMQFRYCEQELPQSELYMMPSINSFSVITKKRYNELKEKVRNGSTLYISVQDGYMTEFSEVTGLEVQARRNRRSAEKAIFEIKGESIELDILEKREILLKSVGAEVLGTSQSGNIMLSKYKYGKGTVYFANFPLEIMLADEPGIFYDDSAQYHKIYSIFDIDRTVKAGNKYIGLTEHSIDENNAIIVGVNHSNQTQKMQLHFKEGWQVSEVYYGDVGEIEKNDGVVFQVEKVQ